jgi:hypothetical protein
VGFPATQEEALLLGFDLDGDPEGRSDNGLGRVLAILPQQGLDVQAMLDATFETGRIVILHRLEADDLNETAAASWRTLIGDDVAAPIDLSGAGEFLVAPGAPPGAQVPGRIAAGRFTGGPGAVQIEISLHPSVPLVIHLAGARVEADVSEEGCRNGRIGGGITQEEIDGALIPGLAATLQAMVDDDPAGDLASRLLDLFDSDDDGRITDEDLRESSLIAGLLALDVDLFDATGAFHPLTDGVRDSLSFALGFECVGASFSLPE